MWERTLLRVGPDEDRTTRVRWVQGTTWFGDVRVPADRPTRVRTVGVGELGVDELIALGRQQGFAGRIERSGAVCRWRREIDFQPPASTPDEGRLAWDGDVLVEHGVHVAYVEHWRRLADDGGVVFALRAAEAPRALLVVVDDHFVLARDRARPLPEGGPSLDGILPRLTAAQRRACLDCEVSYGRVQGGVRPWAVELSTRPAREGRGVWDGAEGRPRLGDDVRSRRWQMVESSCAPAEIARRLSL